MVDAGGLLLAFLVARALRATDGQALQAQVDPEAPAATRPGVEPDSSDEFRLRLGRYAFTLEATLGWLAREVAGNEAQFDENLNLESGLLLRETRLEGQAVAEGAGPASFALSTFGVGSNDAGLRGRADFGPVATDLDYARTLYSGTTESDIHTFDFERRRGSWGLEHEAEAGTLRRAGVELSWSEQDGFSLGTRSIDFNRFVEDVPVRKLQRTRGLGGSLGLELGGTTLGLTGGIEGFSARDRRSFSAPDPRFPSFTLSEDFAADDEGRAYRAGTRLARALAAGVELDLGLDWHANAADGSLTAREIGNFNDPSLPFQADTDGVSELDARHFEGDVGARFESAGGHALELRYVREHERERGSLRTTETLDELMGDPPSVATFLDTLASRSDVDLLRAELDAPLGERVDVELDLELGREELFVENVIDGTTVRFFDDSVPLAGAEAAVLVDTGARSELTLSAGYGVRTTETSRIGVTFTFDDTRQSYQELRWRWRGDEEASLQASLRRESRASEAFDSEARLVGAGLNAGCRLRRRLRAEAAFTLRRSDLESDTTFVLLNPGGGFTVVPGVARFEVEEHLGSLALELDVSEDFRPRLQGSFAWADSDAGYDVERVDGTLPWRAREGMELGLDIGWTRFDGEELLDASDYEALVAFFYVRASL